MWGSYFILQGDGVQKSALKMLVKNVSKFSYDSGRRMTQPEEICARVVRFVRDNNKQQNFIDYKYKVYL